jgi:DNA end-binding protein Ku
MVAQNVVGIGKRVVRGREQTLVIRPYGTCGLAVCYMFFENEIRDCDKWVSVQLSEQEVDIASQLIEALTEDFHPEEKFDSYTVNVRKLVESKIPGSGIFAPQVTRETEPAATKDIMAALAESLKTAKAKKAARGKKA